MPLLEIEVVLFAGEEVSSSWAQQIADCAGDILGSSSGQTWVRIRALPRAQYAENHVQIPPHLGPVFVSILKAGETGLESRRREVAELSSAIARITGRPRENVHIVYLPPGAGRVSFGGTLVP